MHASRRPISRPSIRIISRFITQVCIMLAAVCLVRVSAQIEPSQSFRSAQMTFNNYNPGYKDCKVYIANIVVFDCGLQYDAYQW